MDNLIREQYFDALIKKNKPTQITGNVFLTAEKSTENFKRQAESKKNKPGDISDSFVDSEGKIREIKPSKEQIFEFWQQYNKYLYSFTKKIPYGHNRTHPSIMLAKEYLKNNTSSEKKSFNTFLCSGTNLPIIKDAFERNEFPTIYEADMEDYDIDEFDYIKSFIIDRFFKENFKKGIEYIKEYFISLPEKRKLEWINRRMWSSDPDSGLSGRDEKLLYELKTEGRSEQEIKEWEEKMHYHYLTGESLDEFDEEYTIKETINADKILNYIKESISSIKKNLNEPKSLIYTIAKTQPEHIDNEKERLINYEEAYNILKKGKDLSQINNFLIKYNLIDASPYEAELEMESNDLLFSELYPEVTKIILSNIKESGDENYINFLIEYIKRDQFSIRYINKLVDCFENIDINQAVNKLMGIINDKNIGNFRKKIITNILFRLEFGRVGISEEGVKYLEKIYDLGEYNNPDYHISRLTPEGEVGIFNKEKELIKYIQLGDLSSPKKKIKAEVLDFTYETLFIGKENETPQQRKQRLKYLKEFKQNYYKIANNTIFEQTGVRLNNLSFKEQGWFIIHFNEVNSEEKKNLKQFVARYGETGIKTFLAMESDEKNGAKILKIGNSLDKQVAENIFKKFNNLSALVKQSNEQLSKQFFAGDKTIQPAQEILKRASKLLVEHEKKIDKLNYDNLSSEEKTKTNKELISNLLIVKKDIILFTAMFKTAYKEYGELNFEEIKGLTFATKNSTDLQTSEKDEILSLSDERYHNKPGVKKVSREGLIKSFNNQDETKWYILKKDNKIIATMRFDQQEKPGTVYVGSFMVKTGYEGSTIGKTMEKNIFKTEMKNNKEIIAITEAEGIPVSHYVEKQGWVINGMTTKQEVPFYNISKKDLNHKYKTRQADYNNETIIKMGEKNINLDIESLLNEDSFVYKFNEIPTEDERQKIEKILKHNYTITRFIRGEKYGANSYLVFEKTLTE